jgi:hypothetical protein
MLALAGLAVAENSTDSSKGHAVAETMLDAARVMLILLERSQGQAALDPESLSQIARYVMVTLTFAEYVQLDLGKTNITHIETICLADQALKTSLSDYVSEGSLKQEALSYLSSTAELVQRRLSEGHEVFGGEGCYIVRRLDAG